MTANRTLENWSNALIISLVSPLLFLAQVRLLQLQTRFQTRQRDSKVESACSPKVWRTEDFPSAPSDRVCLYNLFQTPQRFRRLGANCVIGVDLPCLKKSYQWSTNWRAVIFASL
jgi:hypothetical protein